MTATATANTRRFSVEIPIIHHNNSNDDDNDRIELFSHELANIPASTLLPILVEEQAPLGVYNLLASLYSLYDVHQARQVMEGAFQWMEDHDYASDVRYDKKEVMRLHGSMAILLTIFSCFMEGNGSGSLSLQSGQGHSRGSVGAGAQGSSLAAEVQDIRASADHYLSLVSKEDMLDPLSQIGKAFLELLKRDYKKAHFWFTSVQKAAEQTASGIQVLPAILGIGCTAYYEKRYNEAMEQFERAVRYFGIGVDGTVKATTTHPVAFSGILTLYSLTLARLGQIDRAIYGFERAIFYHKENVFALVSKSVLEMGGVGMGLISGEEEQNKINRLLQTLSLANILDPTNASAQILLSEFYFQKWNLVVNCNIVAGESRAVCETDMSRSISVGDHVRIGKDFETIVKDVNEEIVDLVDPCVISGTSLPLCKKDYDRVEDLTKSAYTSTKHAALQSEALTVLAKALHCRRDFSGAKKCLLKALELSGKENPKCVALWGLAQCFVAEKKYPKALVNLQNLINRQPTSPEPHALMALILAHQNFVGERSKILGLLKKASELAQHALEYLLIEAETLQHAHEYKQSLKLYEKIVREKIARKDVSEDIWMNMGVLCHELGHFEDSMGYFKSAASKLKESHKCESVRNFELIEECNKDLFCNEDGTWFHCSLAFNIARVHESSLRHKAAAELYKMIIVVHPSYVNAYLRLACLSRDLGDLNSCAQWLSRAVKVEPNNNSVLTLVGNLHTSLLDWAPAQQIFSKVSGAGGNTATYGELSLGNIYFANLTTGNKYAKHLGHAAEYYRRILVKESSNLYAALGLGTVVAEKGDLIRAKEAFNIVRSSSNDSIPGVLINLAHIYLAQQKHAEALQMYQSYLDRQEKSSIDKTDVTSVLLYIAFAHYDWARSYESYNNARAAPANGHYEKCMEYLNTALGDASDPSVVPRSSQQYMLRYNLCMTKLAAANCTLQKLGRNIRRTSAEIRTALDHLVESLEFVEGLLKAKSDPVLAKKVPVGRSMLANFISQCKANIESAKSHLNEELKKEADTEHLREIQRQQAALQAEEEMGRLKRKLEEEQQRQAQRDARAQAKMEKVQNLVTGWGQQAQAEADKKTKKKKGGGTEFTDGDEQIPQVDESAIFGEDSSEEENENNEPTYNPEKDEGKDILDENEANTPKPTNEDLFGDSSSDEELLPADDQHTSSNKRIVDSDDDDDMQEENAMKKRKLIEPETEQ